MNGEVGEQDIKNEEAKMEEQVEQIKEELVCPLEPDKPWEESVCGLIEQRVAEQVIRRLQAEQSPEEVAAPAAEIAGEEPQPTAETETGDELAEATEEEPKEV